MTENTLAGETWLRGATGEWPELRDKVTYPSRAQVLELAVQLSRAVPGHIVEFGVWKGHSTRVIRDELWRARLWDRRQRRKRIYACDSFQGLPEGYENLPAGTFATPVPRLSGVRVVEGFFADSLTAGLAAEVGRVSLAHLDADLESATACALDWVTPLLSDGALLLFDEFCGEDPAECRAFEEWSARTGVRTTLVALFGREPSGKGGMTDRRALFQVIGARRVRKAPPLLPVRLRRRLAARW
ncbi:TylF/MycF family methyltransferase [Actinomadura sp. ATCC 31491]|uniref:TylF/MycF family methyltransferase n=1 Tax=Actinomadura luzonensis TaxID=2805427 RepID=A0ABT0FX39_9ACTN|nr:TylF/MycF/NovP-related O-methyltransferase [Actinomadura luzonensis]MCK2216921.1 TylF/MycF family methyltransferase [Actinomadura luzonensis]